MGVLICAAVGVLGHALKTEDIFPQLFQHVADVSRHVVVALPGQLGNLPAGHRGRDFRGFFRKRGAENQNHNLGLTK